jgi:hypothetical protein
MMTANWPMQTVGAFLGAVPWQGSNSILPLGAPVPAAKSVDWRSQSVRAFFSDIIWDGQRFPTQTASEASQPLSYLLPVQLFFGCFIWQERPDIGVVPKFSTHSTKVPELSLDDLSDLF